MHFVKLHLRVLRLVDCYTLDSTKLQGLEQDRQKSQPPLRFADPKVVQFTFKMSSIDQKSENRHTAIHTKAQKLTIQVRGLRRARGPCEAERGRAEDGAQKTLD